MRGPVALVVVACGCGRIGFDVTAPTDPDGGPVDGGADASGSACTSPRLVAHWPLDETSGAAIRDVTGGHDGVWSDASDDDVAGEAMAGHSGGALFFGTGSRVYVAGFVVPPEGTFAAWLTSDFDDSAAPGGSHPMVMDAPTPRTTISYAADIGAYGLRTNDVSWQTTYSLPGDLTGWFHLAATWSATGAQLYFDGAAVGVPAAGDARSTSPADLYLGTRAQLDREWGGLIDDVRIYDYAMSAAEIAGVHACP